MHQPNYTYERPRGVGLNYLVLRSYIELPVDVPTGTQLMRVDPTNSADPYVIYDRYGAVLYQWPDEYAPTFSEVCQVCREIGLTK